jgi:quercetin dioxygenase-like cupin family protein
MSGSATSTNEAALTDGGLAVHITPNHREVTMPSNQAGAAGTVVRTPLLTALLEGVRPIGRVEIKRIEFQPGQRSPRHLHPCPVVGFIASGAVAFQIDGQPEQILPQGAAFYEPAGTAIRRFDNASDSEPMTFIAFYLLGADQNELIRMLG